MAFFENKPIDSLTKKEIKTFLLHLIQYEKGSSISLGISIICIGVWWAYTVRFVPRCWPEYQFISPFKTVGNYFLSW